MYVSVPDGSDKETKITIGIPAYNERERIGFLLQNLLIQANNDGMEIIVNASGSTDGTTDEVVETTRALRNSSMVRIIKGKERMGKAAALDDIILQATGGIIIFIDADTIIDEHSLNNILGPFFKDGTIGVVSGNVLSLNYGDDLFSFMSRFQRELHHELCLYLTRRNLPPKVNGTFFAFRKDVVKRFPHFIVSDDEYASWCAQSKGYNVVYAPYAIVYTKDPTNLRDYVAKRKRIYCGHLLIKKQLKYMVPTTGMRRVLPLFLRLTLKYWRKIPYIIRMIFLEFICRVLAVFDAARGKVPDVYRVDSAKFTST